MTVLVIGWMPSPHFMEGNDIPHIVGHNGKVNPGILYPIRTKRFDHRKRYSSFKVICFGDGLMDKQLRTDPFWGPWLGSLTSQVQRGQQKANCCCQCCPDAYLLTTKCLASCCQQKPRKLCTKPNRKLVHIFQKVNGLEQFGSY